MWWLLLWWGLYAYMLWRWKPRKLPALTSQQKASRLPSLVPPDRPSVAVLIPARNEAASLPRLLAALRLEAALLSEVIVMDDHSTDETPQIVQAWQGKLPLPLRYLRSEDRGKKAALRTGLKATWAEFIVTMDADTMPLEGALEQLLEPFQRPEVQMSAAYVRFWDGLAYAESQWDKRFLLAFQALEMAGILALTAGSWQRGEPITVNGAFLAYRRSAFEAVGGWGEAPHPGGDDEFFMQRLYEKYGPEALAFSGAVAETRPALSWTEFWHQRRRWLSKQRYSRLSWSRAGLGFAGLTGLLFWFILAVNPPWALLHVGVTGLLQASVIGTGMRAMGLPKFLWWWYPLAQMWYPIYVGLVGLGLLRRGFWWRGRWYGG